jgi:hypothetical protein
MREVRNMDAHVIAYPLREVDGVWVIECSECGPLGTSTWTQVDNFLASHMVGHGAMAEA